MSKHTQGPWTVGGYIHDEDDPSSYPEWVIQKETPLGDLNIAVAIHVQDPEIHKSNAVLIAAAPRMLNALMAARSSIRCLSKLAKTSEDADVIDGSLFVIDEAIASATEV